MGESIPPVSKSQPAAVRDDEDPHQSVTIAPPAFNLEALLGRPTPVPSPSDDSDQHFRMAIEAGARAGTSLAALSKMAAELSGGVVSAKRANEQLVEELSTLRAMLGAATEHEVGLRQRLAELEQEVAAARAEAERERELLIGQHDAFVAALMEEHEEALANRAADRAATNMSADVADLAQKLVRAEAERAQAEAERDEARARAEKRERERDELRAEASQLRARLSAHQPTPSPHPSPVNSPRPPSYRPPPELQLDASELDSALHARASQPRFSAASRSTPRPAEPAHAVVSEQRAAGLEERPAGASAFPRVSTRPGVGGPAPSEPPPPSFGPAPTGWTPLPPAPELPAAPPRPRFVSAASLPPGLPRDVPALKQKPDPTTRPLIGYSLGEGGVRAETLEGARISSKPPQK